MMNNIAVLIMAAGASTRFGSPKQLAMLQGQTLLQRSIDSAKATDPLSVTVVLGANHGRIEPEITGAQITVNHDWHQGLGSSIAWGVKNIDHEADGILVLLADQVQISTQHLVRLAEHFDGNNIVCATYCGSRGVPAIFPRSVFRHLVALTGDNGAKAILQNPPVAALEVVLSQAALDIDRVEDLSPLLQS
ncbi:MAG: nucleotidyltransferase family protein [Porticoccaceae bacterium]|nr:nucleotidyltransferase family protein [Porticoccaceae bacterium]MDG1308100.1 nucleotidyltransferase family protein [Porticoccaceae bacterium]